LVTRCLQRRNLDARDDDSGYREQLRVRIVENEMTRSRRLSRCQHRPEVEARGASRLAGTSVVGVGNRYRRTRDRRDAKLDWGVNRAVEIARAEILDGLIELEFSVYKTNVADERLDLVAHRDSSGRNARRY